MRICFVAPEPSAPTTENVEIEKGLASYRYRILIPAMELAQRHEVFVGIPDAPVDVAIFAKHHGGTVEVARNCEAPIVFDICNDKFGHRDEVGSIYREMCEIATVLTCNSYAMSKRIFECTGREAIPIPDPYEHAEWTPEFSPANPPRLVWFGHYLNHDTLAGLPIPGSLEVLSNAEFKTDSDRVKWTRFSRPEMVRAVREADLVVIPTIPSKTLASENRVVESLRLGKFVIAGPHVESYGQVLGDYIWIGDILDGIKWAYTHQAEVLQKIMDGQELVRRFFCPSAIATSWEAVCKDAIGGSTNNRLAQERA